VPKEEDEVVNAGQSSDPRDSDDAAALQREVVRLNKVVRALMNRVERDTDSQGSHFGLFQTAILLEDQVQARTRELKAALSEIEEINRALNLANETMEREIEERKRAEAELQKEKLEQQALIRRLEDARSQLLQAEKMASLGQLAAGVAHEINNPIAFVNSNLTTLHSYIKEVFALLALYEQCDPQLAGDESVAAAIDTLRQGLDLQYMREDTGDLLAESRDGLDRVKRIVQDLKDFSHVDQVDWQWADLHRGLDSTLNIVHNELKYKADVVKQYGDVPEVFCLPSQLNQVFMNLLVNACQAIEARGKIVIATGRDANGVWVKIFDTGRGIAAEHLGRIFDPFFTTKPVGKGTGLGLSVSYGIVSRHQGRIEVTSKPGQGTCFCVRLPIRPEASGDASAANPAS
jgi:signal transduction histidine kinase